MKPDEKYYEPISYRVTKEEEGWSVKAILHQKMHLSRKLVSRLKFTQQGITLNGKRTYTNVKVREGDLVQARMQQENSDDILPQPIPIDRIYEDDHLLIVNKPAGLIVHPTLGHYQNTLANGVVYYWKQQNMSYRFRPIHRLDQETSGVLCIAKNPYVQQAIQEQMKANAVLKEYLAVVEGCPEPSSGVIDAPIARDPENPHYRMVIAHGAHAVTHYRVVETYATASLVKLRLETGRTHQIRVHMSEIGHPLIGDKLYGRRGNHQGENSVIPIDRQALHAFRLGFIHPIHNDEVLFEAPLPKDIQHLIEHKKQEETKNEIES